MRKIMWKKLRGQKISNKKAIEADLTAWWIIAAALLVMLVIAIIYLKIKGINAISYIRDLLRFR